MWDISVSAYKERSSPEHLYAVCTCSGSGAPSETINIQLQTQRGSSQCMDVIGQLCAMALIQTLCDSHNLCVSGIHLNIYNALLEGVRTSVD